LDDVVDAVVVVSPPEAVLSELRRFIVGRSGSSAGGLLPVAAPESVVVLDAVVDVPELSRRFIVGRFGSLLPGVVVVPEAVVESGLSVVWVDAVSVLVFEPKCGWLASFDVAMTGKVLDGFSAAVFRGADRGLTLP
jgi:hypothetical protein